RRRLPGQAVRGERAHRAPTSDSAPQLGPGDGHLDHRRSAHRRGTAPSVRRWNGHRAHAHRVSTAARAGTRWRPCTHERVAHRQSLERQRPGLRDRARGAGARLAETHRRPAYPHRAGQRIRTGDGVSWTRGRSLVARLTAVQVVVLGVLWLVIIVLTIV